MLLVLPLLLLLVCQCHLVTAGTCAFKQSCFQVGTDTACTPTAYEDGEIATSFAMDDAHGFGIVHDQIWDGTVVGKSGVCSNGGVVKEDYKCYTAWNTPKGLEAIAPIICPEYTNNSCCTWQANYALYQNLGTLVQSFGGTTGCLACAVNLVQFWCGLICSPDQGAFMDIHDPAYVTREDDLTGERSLVLQADVRVAADYACGIYESCRGTAIVGETTAMASGLGLLNFQMQTGAVGHGEYFFLHFTDRHNTSTSTSTSTTKAADASGDGLSPAEQQQQQHISDNPLPGDSEGRSSTNGDTGSFSNSGKSVGTFDRLADILACDDYWDPGTPTIPFPYPPPKLNKTKCGCNHCPASCSSSEKLIDIVIADDPIPLLGGFSWLMVGCVYAAVVVGSVVLPRLTLAQGG